MKNRLEEKLARLERAIDALCLTVQRVESMLASGGGMCPCQQKEQDLNVTTSNTAEVSSWPKLREKSIPLEFGDTVTSIARITQTDAEGVNWGKQTLYIDGKEVTKEAYRNQTFDEFRGYSEEKMREMEDAATEMTENPGARWEDDGG